MISNLFEIEALLLSFLGNLPVLSMQRVVLIQLFLAYAWISFEDPSHQSHVLAIDLHSLTLLIVNAQTANGR